MPITISDLLSIPLIMDFDFDQDGRYVIYSSNETGIPQLYSAPLTPYGQSRQITTGEDPVLIGTLSPDGANILYPQDKDGNEKHHLFILRIEDGKARRLTEEPYRTLGMDWRPDGKEVTRTFVSREACGLETFNLVTAESFKLKELRHPFIDVQYSHDGKWLACTMAPSFTNTQIFIINREDPEDTITYSIDDNSKEELPAWSPSSEKLAFASDARGKREIVIQRFQGEERIFLELGKDEEVTQTDRAIWSPTNDKIYYVVSKQSQTKIHSHPIDGRREPALPFPEGSVAFPKISRDGKIIVALHSSLKSPYGLYMHKIGSEVTTPITSREFGIDLNELAEPHSVWYNSFDRRKIHSWYIPSALNTTAHHAVINVHGGPWGQVFDSWFEGVFMHCLSQNGFGILAPNFRGSTGYGAEFQNLDIGDVGGGDLEDIVHAAKWLRDRAREAKIAIMGASYGGYMTLMALTEKPEIFAAGISLVPIVDWLELYELSDPLFRAFEETILGGPPAEKENLYRERSPITHVHEIKAPVLIVAGEKDSRCPIQPIRKFIDKLEEIKHPHDYVLEENAGHISAFLNREESIPLYEKMINYLKTVLDSSPVQ